jgi:hypothetical protein
LIKTKIVATWRFGTPDLSLPCGRDKYAYFRVGSNAMTTPNMNILDKIKYHYNNRKYCKVMRQVAKDTVENSNGFIVDYSDNFVLLQETDDFEVGGYVAFPIETISEILYSNNDKYFDKIMHLEGIVDRIENIHQIDLTSWATILKSIKKLGFNVIVENEDPKDESFDIGPITKITKSSVYIRYFNPKGILDEDATEINWDLITIIRFDTKYINIFSKYLREPKPKQKTNLA